MELGSCELKVDWLFPGDEPVLRDAVVSAENGWIVAIGSKSTSETRNLGPVALVPGLVNSHTHLEFSDLPHPVQPSDPFTSWVRALVAVRRIRQSGSDGPIASGLAECLHSGITLAGEIATCDWPVYESLPGCPRLVVFRELIGLSPEAVSAQLQIARDHLQAGENSRSRSNDLPRAIAGLSPHAPYSVHPDLFLQLVELASKSGAPLAIHLAETEAELELLEQGTGPFVDLLKDFGVWRAELFGGRTAIQFLEPLSRLQRALVIHGNYLTDEALDFLAAHPQICVVYCPRTHAWFGHRNHPWRAMLSGGVSLAIGTDSRGSNPDLNLWRELQFLRRLAPDLDDEQLLRLGTLAGAEALGMADECGSLQVGKQADWVVIRMAAAAISGSAPQLFHAENRIACVYSAGRCQIHANESECRSALE